MGSRSAVMGAHSGETMETDVRAAIAVTEAVLEEDHAMDAMEAIGTSKGKEIQTTTILLSSSSSSLRPQGCRQYQWEAPSKSCRRKQRNQLQTEVYHLRLGVSRRLQRLHSKRLEEADGC